MLKKDMLEEKWSSRSSRRKEMNAEKLAPRLLGAAFLFVAVVSLISGLLLMQAIGSGSISDNLVNVSHQLNVMRLGSLGELVTSSSIIVLAALLYIVLHKQNRIIALVALGCWLAEAIFLALSQIGTFALLPLSQNFVQAGAPPHAFYQTLGTFLYSGVYNQGITIHMWFYCIGGLLWYALFYTSKYIPRVISLWGLLAVFVGLIGIVLQVLGYDVPIFVYLPIGLFEVTIGVWLLIRGIKEQPQERFAPASSLSTIHTEAMV
jgi:hypothetical protein